MSWLTNATIISAVQIIVGLLVKYFPAFAKIENAAIPWINAILGFLIAVFTPSAAHALAGSVAPADAGAVTLPLAAGQGFWQSLISSLIYDKLVQPVVEKLFHWKKAV